MSAGPGHPSLRARIADSIAKLLHRRSPTDLASTIGVAPTTVSRRGDDVRAWFGDGLDLAIQCDDVRSAVVTFMTGETAVEGEAIAAPAALMREMAEDGQLVTAIAEALKDGRVDRDEARNLIKLINTRRDEEDRDLLPALRKIADE